MEKGILQYNSYTKRYEFFPDNGGEETALHCGNCLDVYNTVTGKWKSTRIEVSRGEWCLVGTKFFGEGLEGLKVRL